MTANDDAVPCTCQPEIISPTPSMIARGFTEWLHHQSRCAITVVRQQPITADSDGGA